MTPQPKLYAPEFVGVATRGYRRAMGQVVAKKIRALRMERGWNQAELAERTGVTQASVSRWEKGSMPEADKLALLAEMAGETVRSFIADNNIELSSATVLNRFWVRGTVAAGVFSAAYEWPREDWTPYSGGSHVEAPEGARFGLKTVGPSMNLIYPEGTVLDCIKIDHAGELQSGQRVIVERIRIDGEIEATVKEYVIGEDGKQWLVPRSSDPAFQAPISATEPDDDIAEVRVIAVVVGSYRPE